MPRHGHTRRTERKKNAGHRMHRKGRIARRARAKYPKRAIDHAETKRTNGYSAATEAGQEALTYA